MKNGIPVIPEAVAETLRQAYQEGWKSAQHWPNRHHPFEVEISWKVDPETSTLVFKVRELVQ